MKFLKILFTLTFIYTLLGIPLLHASSSIDPAIRRITLAQGERKYGSVVFKNGENKDIQVLLTPYTYNPKTDEITEDKKNIFIKVDTDSIKVKANSSYNIKYEILPLSNLPDGTYFNILAITPVTDSNNVKINLSVSQLVILNVVDPKDQVRGITTTQYSTQIEVKRRGIPFILPTVLKYSIKNNSNYLLTPQGRIDIFNEKNSYQPTYLYLNEKGENIYPGETLEKEIKVPTWYIQDLFIKRIVKAQVYNGVDNNAQDIEIEINNYIFELLALLIVTVIGILLSKSLAEDISKKRKA
ncbi:MAG: hypothetical protein RBS01_02965 [Candidatus Dojkabacteria bacterium]|jgi:hypothetical protein|nr:hypothetical protein [Candidatus Dojkabacteria bacterium]